jgi:hypothetical protein
VTDAIVQAAGPCWVLRLANGNTELGDWPDLHHPSEAEAAEAAADQARADGEPVRHIPVQLAERCWEATAVCGYRYDEDGDEGRIEHAETYAELLDGLTGHGWKPIEGGGMTCGDDGCDECCGLATVAPPVEIPGQMKIGE